jgi:hypothetical protein
MVRDEAQTIAKDLKDHRIIRIALARRGLDQRIEYSKLTANASCKSRAWNTGTSKDR